MMKLKQMALAAALSFASSAWAFMPAPGIWQIDAESTGAPGRGFQIEVQNEIAFFTYFGYRADGSSLFYYAAGPVANNVFSADLLDIQSGTIMGSPYQAGNVKGSVGTINVSFTSGEHGSITLPGESAKAISKNNFGYPKGPDGLLGSWLLTEIMGSSAVTDLLRLTQKLGASTSNGNGVVTTASTSFRCEYQITGILLGQVVCGSASGAVVYGFKFAGDNGAGIMLYNNVFYEVHAIRFETKTGKKTGLNDGTSTTVTTYDNSDGNSTAKLDAAIAASTGQANVIAFDDAKAQALADWAAEMRALPTVAQ